MSSFLTLFCVYLGDKVRVRVRARVGVGVRVRVRGLVRIRVRNALIVRGVTSYLNQNFTLSSHF